jgi:hypothetical protein
LLVDLSEKKSDDDDNDEKPEDVYSTVSNYMVLSPKTE